LKKFFTREEEEKLSKEYIAKLQAEELRERKSAGDSGARGNKRKKQ